MQSVIYTVRQLSGRMGSTILCKIDIFNAFNSIMRRACVSEADNIDPLLGCWSSWKLASPTLITSSGYGLTAVTGLFQGDPISPVLFCAGIKPLMEEIKIKFPELEDLSYLDDEVIYGTPEAITRVIAFIQDRLAKLGMKVNQSKCELYAGTPLPTDAVPVQQVIK